MLLAKILNRARLKATVGRDIRVVSSDGVLDLCPYSNATRGTVPVPLVLA